MSKYLLKTRQLDLNFKRQNWLSQMQTHLNEGRFGDDWTKYSHFPFYIGFYILDYTAVKLLCLFHATYVAEITCACCFFFFFAGYNIYNTSTKNSKALFNIYLVVRLFAQFTPFFVWSVALFHVITISVLIWIRVSIYNLKSCQTNQRYFRTSFWKDYT